MRPLSRARSISGCRSSARSRVDERLDADVVAVARLRQQLVERALRLELDVALREHLVRPVLRRLHVGLVERVDPEDRAGDGDGELPAEELLPELVRARKRDVLAAARPAGRPGAGTMPLPCLPVDSATSCSIQRPNESADEVRPTLAAPPSREPELEPGIALREAARLLHLERPLEQPRRRRCPSAPRARSRTATAPSSGRRSSARRGRRAGSRARGRTARGRSRDP